ncbi:putative two-component response regulator ARR12-like, partial [Capsicum annuum]
MVLAIPYCGFAWRLVNENIHGVRAPADGKANVSFDDGSMTYAQIRDFIEVLGLAMMILKCVRDKVNYIKSQGLLGYYAWHIAAAGNFSVLSEAAALEADQDTQGGLVNKKRKLNRLVSILVPIGAILTLILLVFIIWHLQRRQILKFQASHIMESKSKARKGGESNNLQVFSFDEMKEATNNFSFANKLGQGGYGPVYKGKLKNGQEIAVKRLSETSSQGLEEFENEVILTAKLQHINLVKVVGFCIENEEKMLIYEYMPNKSLDYYIYSK